MRSTIPLYLCLLLPVAAAGTCPENTPCGKDLFPTVAPQHLAAAGPHVSGQADEKGKHSEGSADVATGLFQIGSWATLGGDPDHDKSGKVVGAAGKGEKTAPLSNTAVLPPSARENDSTLTGSLEAKTLATPLQKVGTFASGITAGALKVAATAEKGSVNIEEIAGQDKTPGVQPEWRTIKTFVDSGDTPGAVAAARGALARHPDDAALQVYVRMNAPRQQTRVTEKTVSDRAKELMATLRGDAGEAPPPGAALASSPELASTLAFPALGGAAAPRALTPAALAALSRQDSGVHLTDPLVRSAVGRIMVRDLPAAKTLLDRRLEQNPSDEPALRFRALTLRQMGKFEPSSHDAKAALNLAPWDARAHSLLIQDEVDLGHPGQALEEANAALRETPNNAELYAARAGVYASLGQREAQLADLKQAAALDEQFDQIYRQALAGPATASFSRRPHSTTVWLGAVGTALLFFSFALFRKRGDSSVRLAMRADDHALLARGARPDAAPAGFRIVKTLGQGGMGVVYEAVDLGLQRTVALKKLRSEIADSPRERARFLKEARTVAGLKHPNIVEIHSIHEDAEGLFLVFEKVDGETLHERLGRGALTPGEAVAYLRQIAKALDCAHSSGVVHQDLKPANVMVAGDTAKVMDFGIARRVQETMSTLSRVEVAGTPAYMAPEQELGGAVGPAADVFALGACSYELLTGRTPFPSGGMMMKSQKMYRPASELDPRLTAAVDNALSRAMEPEPAARWPSASSFVEALARSLS